MPQTKRKAKEQDDVELAHRNKIAKQKAFGKELLKVLEKRDEWLGKHKRSDGNRGDGTFYIHYVSVGQGDCTLMTTPDGRVILVDCGSSEHPATGDFYERLKQKLLQKVFLKHDRVIDVIVLTHPDKDHHNALKKALIQAGVTTIHAVYCSGSIGDYKHTAWHLYKTIPDFRIVRDVVMNDDPDRSDDGSTTLKPASNSKKEFSHTRPPDSENGYDVNVITDVGIRIVAEDNCDITIIAAGVEDKYDEEDEGTDINRASIVLHVKAFEENLLLMGDGTAGTERFLMATQEELLGNTSSIRIGHHGSTVTSSLQEFVEMVRAQIAVVSADAAASPSNWRHPHWEALDRYVAVMDRDVEELDTPNTVNAYNYEDDDGYKPKNIKYDLDATEDTKDLAHFYEAT
ncbi:ComEC/Rec2 family competence protein [Acrocarpospora catenulata]|uniref:ComEC/Rec2 family competence protein n=1 Tax=Acrocarpospora catenulata TaxID=2836182 RepID=UPI001BD9F2B6|nr:hypothetical protein [Acrocarpospora catenulata]